jgi:hypothetical protein
VPAAPFDRDKAERARSKFTEIQALIDALDRAISGEEGHAKKMSQRAKGWQRVGSTARILPVSSTCCPYLLPSTRVLLGVYRAGAGAGAGRDRARQPVGMVSGAGSKDNQSPGWVETNSN